MGLFYFFGGNFFVDKKIDLIFFFFWRWTLLSDPTHTLMNQLRVGVNNVARATIGSSKEDRLKVADLLDEAGFPSINRLVIYTTAMECWRALNL